MKRHFLILTAIFLFSNTVQGWADETMANAQERFNLVGMGAVVSSSPYEGDDASAYPVPIVWWSNERFFIEGQNAGMIVYENDDLRADLLVSPRLQGYEDDDATILNGMEDRKWTVEAGGQFSIKLPSLEGTEIKLRAVQDVLDEHGGYELEAAVEQKISGSFFQLVPRVGARWQSEDLVDYYYGVRPSEVTGSRANYEPDGTLNYFVRLSYYMGIERSENWFLISRVEAEFLGDEIKDSPLVNEDVIYSGVLGLVRKF